MKKEKELKIYDSVLIALKIKKLHMIIWCFSCFPFYANSNLNNYNNILS